MSADLRNAAVSTLRPSHLQAHHRAAAIGRRCRSTPDRVPVSLNRGGTPAVRHESGPDLPRRRLANSQQGHDPTARSSPTTSGTRARKSTGRKPVCTSVGPGPVPTRHLARDTRTLQVRQGLRQHSQRGRLRHRNDASLRQPGRRTVDGEGRPDRPVPRHGSSARNRGRAHPPRMTASPSRRHGPAAAIPATRRGRRAPHQDRPQNLSLGSGTTHSCLSPADDRSMPFAAHPASYRISESAVSRQPGSPPSALTLAEPGPARQDPSDHVRRLRPPPSPRAVPD